MGDGQGNEIAQLLRFAAVCIEQNEADAAAWRVADAGLMLRKLLEEQGVTEATGLTRETGRGALLPESQFAAVSR